MNIDELKLVEDCDGNLYHIEKMIGSGGQGAVYRLEEKELAIKVLTNNDEIIENTLAYDKFEDIITDIIILKDEEDIHLCKPIKMLKKPLCGYIMKLINNLEPVNNMIFSVNAGDDLNTLLRNTHGIKKRYDVLTELARTLARLHSNGLVYCDISPNNVFYSNIDKLTKVWLIDCDNLKFMNEIKKGIFTPNFGAPEIENNISPNTIFSDCYSFALLAFKLLTNNNAIEYEDESDEDWDASTSRVNNGSVKYGKFIMNDLDDQHKEYYSHFLTKEVLNLFNETFSQKSMLNPSLRPSMREWYETLKNVTLQISKCEKCGSYLFSGEPICYYCDSENSKSNIGTFCKLLPHYVDDAKEVFNKLEDEDFIIDDNIKNKIIMDNTSNKFAFHIYDGLVIYDDLFNSFSINNYPSEALKFEKDTLGFYIYNISKNMVFGIKNNQSVETLKPNERYFISENKTNIIYKDKVTGFVFVIGVYLNVKQ